MEIVKHGERKVDTVQFRCRDCGCVFRAVKNIECHSSTERNETVWKAACPESFCKKDVYA